MCKVTNHFAHGFCIRTAYRHAILRFTHFGSGDHLHRFSDLLRVLDACDLTTYLFCASSELLLNALRPALRQAARRYRGLGCFEGIEDAFQLAFDFVVVATGLVDLLHQRSVITVDVSQQSGFEAANFRQFNIRRNHVLLRTEPETAAQRTSAHTVSVSAVRSLSDRGQAAYVLHRQGRMQTERTLPVHDTVPERYGYHRTVFHDLGLCCTTNTGYGNTRVNRRTNTGVEQVGFGKI